MQESRSRNCIRIICLPTTIRICLCPMTIEHPALSSTDLFWPTKGWHASISEVYLPLPNPNRCSIHLYSDVKDFGTEPDTHDMLAKLRASTCPPASIVEDTYARVGSRDFAIVSYSIQRRTLTLSNTLHQHAGPEPMAETDLLKRIGLMQEARMDASNIWSEQRAHGFAGET